MSCVQQCPSRPVPLIGSRGILLKRYLYSLYCSNNSPNQGNILDIHHHSWWNFLCFHIYIVGEFLLLFVWKIIFHFIKMTNVDKKRMNKATIQCFFVYVYKNRSSVLSFWYIHCSHIHRTKYSGGLERFVNMFKNVGGGWQLSNNILARSPHLRNKSSLHVMNISEFILTLISCFLVISHCPNTHSPWSSRTLL